MSYSDTISRLENQIAQLQDARMEEARERDRLRSHLEERGDIVKYRRACDEILAMCRYIDPEKPQAFADAVVKIIHDARYGVSAFSSQGRGGAASRQRSQGE